MANTNRIRILDVILLTHPTRTLELSVFGNLIAMPMFHATTKVDCAKVMRPIYQINWFFLGGCQYQGRNITVIGKQNSVGKNRAQNESQQKCITRLLPLIAQLSRHDSQRRRRTKTGHHVCYWEPANQCSGLLSAHTQSGSMLRRRW